MCSRTPRSLCGCIALEVRRLARRVRVSVVNSTETVLFHTLIQEDLALITRLRGHRIIPREPNAPNIHRCTLELANISQLLHNRPLCVNRAFAIATATAARTNTIGCDLNHLAPLYNHSHMKTVQTILLGVLALHKGRRQIVQQELLNVRHSHRLNYLALVREQGRRQGSIFWSVKNWRLTRLSLLYSQRWYILSSRIL